MNNSMGDIRNQLDQCAFLNWFEIFEKDAIAGIAIPIPNPVLEYLQDEIIVLPKECYPCENRDSVIEFNSESIEEAGESDGYESDACIIEPEFPEFSKKISDTIQQLPDCSAFLKAKWHCPKDSYWITAGQTLKVKDITDVYQLLKASSIVKRDMFDGGLPENLIAPSNGRTDVTSNQSDQYIVLKEWHEIHPGTEFRCFVRERNLIAISPRDWPSFHQFIVEQKREVCSDIISLFKEKIKDRFPLENFVFDVVRVRKDHVLLVDFSPFNENFTESLAFDWSELNDEHNFQENDEPEFRYLPADCGIQPSKRNNYGIPFDIAEMFKDSSEAKYSDLSSLLSKVQNSTAHS